VETRALRREERVARLLELVADVGESGTRFARGQVGELLAVARQRLRAALEATCERLPACERLLGTEWPSYTHDSRAAEREAEALAAVEAALNEVATLLAGLRD
jgi:hypothetical protein